MALKSSTSPSFGSKVIEQVAVRSGMDSKMAELLASAAIFIKMGVLQNGISAMVVENKNASRKGPSTSSTPLLHRCYPATDADKFSAAPEATSCGQLKMPTNPKGTLDPEKFLCVKRYWNQLIFLVAIVAPEEDRVTFTTGTLTNDALSWWNAYAQPIGIEQANRIT
ncbi:hypothetical protein Tco_0975918 [Tanacetum coccineum]|uniref:Reverse transcriptase domain-containing protein n=1 Tax=Tanacetum coccineum TaxID=301880 RepID=A0ABQ5EFS9_9ASTR